MMNDLHIFLSSTNRQYTWQILKCYYAKYFSFILHIKNILNINIERLYWLLSRNIIRCIKINFELSLPRGNLLRFTSCATMWATKRHSLSKGRCYWWGSEYADCILSKMERPRPQRHETKLRWYHILVLAFRCDFLVSATFWCPVWRTGKSECV